MRSMVTSLRTLRGRALFSFSEKSFKLMTISFSREMDEEMVMGSMEVDMMKGAELVPVSVYFPSSATCTKRLFSMSKMSSNGISLVELSPRREKSSPPMPIVESILSMS